MFNHEGCRIEGTRRPLETALAALFAVWMLAGCETTTVPEYKPRGVGELVGYTDLQLTPNRYRVSFSGSTASTRDDVEQYLLRRAAEVTLQTGHTHFMLTNRDTERENYYPSYPDNYLGGPYYYYYPYRSWYGSYGGYPYYAGNPWSTTSYSAYAEIVMFSPEEARNNPQAIDALGLLQRLQPPLPVASATPLPRS